VAVLGYATIQRQPVAYTQINLSAMSLTRQGQARALIDIKANLAP